MDITKPANAAQERGPALRGGTDTRRRLVESAVEVFAERGYHAASLSEIAARAGLTTGAVYSTFGSKKALLLAASTEAATDDNIDAMLGGDAGLRRGLETIYTEVARTGNTPQSVRLLKMQIEALKLGLADAEVFAILAASGRRQLERTTRFLTSAAERDGVPLPLPASDLAILLTALLNGLSLIQLVDTELAPERLFHAGLRALMGWKATTDRTDTARTRRRGSRTTGKET
jgi:AcrR family transcriptional regulator